MTVRQMLASLDSAELTEWIAFFELEAKKDEPDPDDPETWRKAFGA